MPSPALHRCPYPAAWLQVALKTFFRVRPRIIRAVQGLGLLIAIILAGAALLHVLANSRGQNILWIDCLCASAPRRCALPCVSGGICAHACSHMICSAVQRSLYVDVECSG